MLIEAKLQSHFGLKLKPQTLMVTHPRDPRMCAIGETIRINLTSVRPNTYLAET